MKKITKITYNNGNIFKFDNTRVFAFITGEENIFEYFKQHNKSTCHMIEKRGQSKGKLLGIAFYPANFNTGPHYLTTLTLEELKERLI